MSQQYNTSQQISRGDEASETAWAELSTRELATLPEERTARATEALVKAVPHPLESLALSIVSTASAIVLAGVLLIVIADAVDLIGPINVWPLISLALLIAAGAAIAAIAGLRQRAGALLREAKAPWSIEGRLDGLEGKIDEIRGELRQSREVSKPE